MSVESLFEDPHTDARMRRTIPQFAFLGGAVVAVTCPLVVRDGGDRLRLLAIVAVALVVAAGVRWRDVIDRVPRDVIFGLLLAYIIIISFAIVVTGDAATPYGVLYLLPVTFGSIFFAGIVRYALAAVAPVVDFIVVGSFLPVAGTHTAVRLVMFVLLAHFGAVVAETLREALRAIRSLHSVLEAASGAPLDSDLASIGVEAALFVAGWDAGAVVLLHDGYVRVPAVRGLSPSISAYYRERPDELVAGSLAREVLEDGALLQIDEIAATDERAGHPLVAEGIVSVASLPITFHGEIIGALMVGHRSRRRLDRREEDRLRRVAEQLGLALGSAAAYRRETEVAEHLRELNRRKDEFLANVSHELRTPAAAIGLVANTLRSSSSRLTDSLREEMLETLERRARQLSALIENLLEEALADAGATRLTITDLDWAAAVTRWADVAALDTGRSPSLHLPHGPIPGSGDAVKLERVVVNLLSNAAKFSEPGTPIDLTLDVEDEVVVLVVADHGIGIPPVELPRVFERFHQVDGGATRTAGGFGIGLSLVDHFVAVHGGTITVTSDVGRGTTFTVRLPRTAAAAIAVAVAEDPDLAPSA